jgi:hypothetical protein
MDPATIQQIAAEVVARLPYGNRYWLVFVVNAVVAALIGAIAVLGTSYLRTRAQNLATKHDFDELRKQLKANTELVEMIKAEVGQRDWAQREWTNLRRIKLEALLTVMHECQAHLDRHRQKILDGELLSEPDPQLELATIAELYFPELTAEVAAFSREYRTQKHHGFVLLAQLQHMGNDLDARQEAIDKYSAEWKPELVIQASHVLRAAARRLLVSIMGVED